MTSTTHYLYKVINKENGNFYIGFTKNPRIRWRDHKRNAKTGEESRFYNAMRKHGKVQFEFIVLEEVATRQDAKDREMALIAELKPEYNCTAGGDGVDPCEETRRKRSISMKTSPKAKAHLDTLWDKRRANSTPEEISRLCSETQANMTPEQKAQKSRKLAEAQAARTQEEEAERQRRRAETVASWTPEQHEEYRQKLSESNKNRILSEETQAKIDAGAKQGGHITGQLMKARLAAMSPEEYAARNKNLGNKIREGRASDSPEKKAERERKRLESRARNKAAKEAANK